MNTMPDVLKVLSDENRRLRARGAAEENKSRRLEAERDALRKALDYVIRDLEMRSNLKRGEEKGLVDIGDGAYQQAKAALAATEVKP